MIGTAVLLNSLHDYHLLLTEISVLVAKTRKDRGAEPIRLEKRTSLSYTFVRLQLEETEEGALFLLCEFRIDGTKISCQQVFCEDKELEQAVKKMIFSKAFTWEPGSKSDQYDPDYKKYFFIADEIARKGYNCSSGDNYSPGYFSNMIIGENGILLEQVNHWNSRSSDHKDDYYLRDLKFHIPFPKKEVKVVMHDYEIGDMLINFSDSSSRNNRGCGDAILKTILEEKAKF